MILFFFLDKKETKNQDYRKKAQNLRVIFLPENKAAAGVQKCNYWFTLLSHFLAQMCLNTFVLFS